MSDAPAKKRCPNCAWAIKRAETLQLSPGESWVLVVIAELVDGITLRRRLTQTELAARTRMTPRTVYQHVQALVTAKCLEIERTREGYHYHLLRRVDPPQPIEWPEMDEAVAQPDPQNFPIPNPVVMEPEPQNFPVPPPQSEEIAASNPQNFPVPSVVVTQPEPQNFPIPLMKTPLVESKKERTSLRSVARTRARRIPEDWRPTDSDRQYAIDKGVNPDLLAEEFLLFWIAASGPSSAKLNWSAAFKGRVLRMAEQGRFPLRGRRQDLSKFEIIHAENGTTSLWATMNDDTPAIEVDRPMLSIVGGRAP